MMKKIDDIIVGKGIMGSFLSHELLKLGRNILIYDNDTTTKNSCSLNSGGLVSPISPHSYFMNKLTKKIYDTKIYDELSEKHSEKKKKFAKKIPRIKIFNDEKDKESFIKASKSNSFLENIFSEKTKKIKEEILPFCNLDYGIGVINEDFNLVVDVPLLMDSFVDQFKKDNVLVEKNFEIEKIRNIDNGDYKFSYQEGDSEILCKNIVFCEGYLGYKNPYFDDLSWRLVKGRSLVIKFKNESLLPDILKSRNCILNFHHNLFKISETENIYEFGSTYEPLEIKSMDNFNDKENTDLDEEKNSKLIENLKKSLNKNIDFELLYIKEGIRPCSIDMVNPFVGKSLKRNNIYILNGFGSKSFSIGPYLSNNLATHLIFGNDIHPNADTIRFMGN